MSSFRRFGGLNFSSNNNIVKSNISNANKLNITNKTGLPNSKQIFASHIDLSGNSILHTGTIYFQDGTSMSSSSSGGSGTQGPQGYTGAPGEQGATGPQGYTGAPGEQGATGPQGYTGAPGEQGATGPQGYTGAPGEQGATGPQGYTGAPGEQGATGPQGYTGAPGEQGATGPQGYTGAQGPAGSGDNYWTQSSNNIYPTTIGNYVGIGETAPNFPLDVIGNCQVTSGASGSTSYTSPTVIIIKDPGNASDFQYVWQHSAQLQVQNTGSYNANGYTADPIAMSFGVSSDGVCIIQGNQVNVGYNNICLNPIIGQNSGYVGIGTYTPTSALDVVGNINVSANLGITGANGNITASGNITATGNITAGSDYRIKKDITPLNTDTYSVDNLNPVQFKFKQSDKESIGLIAHELQEHFPFLVEGTKDGKEIQSVNYIGLIGVLIKEIQELKRRVANLELKPDTIV
jgi:hypothetical protein